MPIKKPLLKSLAFHSLLLTSISFTFSSSIPPSYPIPKNQTIYSLKINSCLQMSTTKRTLQKSVEWYVIASNSCQNPKKIHHQLQITKAINLDISKGLILQIQELIIPSQDKKIVLLSFQNYPKKKGYLAWKLIPAP